MAIKKIKAHRRAAPQQPAPNAAVLAALEEGSQAPSEASLESLRRRIAECRELESEIAGISERLKEKSDELTRIRTRDLPAMFEKLRIGDLTLKADGNYPAYQAQLKPFYSAKLPDDPQKKQAAFRRFKWLAGLSKTEIKIAMGKGDDKRVKKITALLKKNKVEFSSKTGVLPQTLTAEIRRRHEDGKPLSPSDQEALGAFVGTVVQLTKIEEQ